MTLTHTIVYVFAIVNTYLHVNTFLILDLESYWEIKMKKNNYGYIRGASWGDYVQDNADCVTCVVLINISHCQYIGLRIALSSKKKDKI